MKRYERKFSEGTLKIGDIIGNTVQGFNFKVLEINSGLYPLKVKDLKTGKIFKTTYENMYLPGSKK